jgi:hypothetical protein
MLTGIAISLCDCCLESMRGLPFRVTSRVYPRHQAFGSKRTPGRPWQDNYFGCPITFDKANCCAGREELAPPRSSVLVHAKKVETFLVFEAYLSWMCWLWGSHELLDVVVPNF